MKKTKKWLALLLVMIMAASLLSACGGAASGGSSASEQAPAASSSAAANSETKTSSEEAAPVESKIEFSWVPYIQVSGGVAQADSINEKYLEEKYNCIINIEEVDIHDPEQYNLYWSTGNIPDVSVNRNLNIQRMVDQGLLRSFPYEWLEEYSPTYLETINTFAGDAEITKAQISFNGESYILPTANYAGAVGYLMAIRKDWLDNLGLSMPTSIDELHDVLYAFTFNDPDGNGEDDTYGIHGAASMRFGYIFSSNGFWPNSWYKNADGTVYNTSTTEKFKEVLKLLAAWYKEGIIDPEMITDDRSAQRDKWAQGKFGVLVDNPWWFAPETPNNLTKMLADVDPDAVVEYIDPFPGEDGVRRNPQWYSDLTSDGGVMFGADCPDEVVKLILTIAEDMTTDMDFYKQMVYGVEGVDYNMVDGKVVPTEESGTNERIQEVGMRQTFQLGALTAEDTFAYILGEKESKDSLYAMAFPKVWMGNDFLLPNLSDDVATYRADCDTIIDEFYFGGISGEVDIEAEWADYLKRLDDAGYQEVCKAYAAG